MTTRSRKLPWCQAYAADHLADPALAACSPATRGVWVDWLCHMHLSDRCGQVRGTAEELARLGRCSPAEALAAIEELKRTAAAEVELVTQGHGEEAQEFIVSNRRMRREYEARKSNADRQMRHREKKRNCESNGTVAPESRERGQRLYIKPPPPEAQTSVADAEWEEVEAALFRLGIAEAASAVAEARLRGLRPADVQELVAHWREHSGRRGWGVGLLKYRISVAHPELATNEGWPPGEAAKALSRPFRAPPPEPPEQREARIAGVRATLRAALTNGRAPPETADV